MVWVCCAAVGSEQFVIMNGTINSALHLICIWIIVRTTNQSNTSRFPSKWLKQIQLKVLEWPSQTVTFRFSRLGCCGMSNVAESTVFFTNSDYFSILFDNLKHLSLTEAKEQTNSMGAKTFSWLCHHESFLNAIWSASYTHIFISRIFFVHVSIQSWKMKPYKGR